MIGRYEVRESLKRKIREHGWSIAATARAAGVSYACLSAIVNGRAYPSRRVSDAISEVLGENPDALFGDNAPDGDRQHTQAGI